MPTDLRAITGSLPRPVCSSRHRSKEHSSRRRLRHSSFGTRCSSLSQAGVVRVPAPASVACARVRALRVTWRATAAPTIAASIRPQTAGVVGLGLRRSGLLSAPRSARGAGAAQSIRRAGWRVRRRDRRALAACGERQLGEGGCAYRSRGPPGGAGTGSATAAAAGSASMRSSCVMRRNPSVCSARSTG